MTIMFACLNTNAQVNIFQNTISKLNNYKTLSFQYFRIQKEGFGDTLKSNSKFLFLKEPANKELGYLYKHEYAFGEIIDLYDGKIQSSLNLVDSTYQENNLQASTFNLSLLGQLLWMKKFLTNNPNRLTQMGDTIVNSINSYHLIFNIRDTIANDQHVYVHRHLFIDKITNLPVSIVNRARGTDFSAEVADFYSEEAYSDYHFEIGNVDNTSFSKPEGFHLFKERTLDQSALLKVGSLAPGWTLYDTDNKKTLLSQFKGKIVLLDFFFVGCIPCIKSLSALDNLRKKYIDKDFTILSISTRDKVNLVKEFKNSQKIKNLMFANGGDVANLYHAYSAPIFYLIDQKGKISSAIGGYSNELERELSIIIESLLQN